MVKGIVGHECVNEIIVQRLLDHIGAEHLQYTLIHATVRIDGRDFETYLCESLDFKKETEVKIALDDYYLMEKEDTELPLAFCIRKGWEQYISEMLLVDYLVLNRDRHGANIEVLRDEKTRSVRLAPLFDHGLSLLCSCHSEDDIAAFDVMADRKVQSFVGTSSASENIKLVSKEYIKSLPAIGASDIDSLFEGLEGVISEAHIDRIHDMILGRWCSLDSI